MSRKAKVGDHAQIIGIMLWNGFGAFNMITAPVIAKSTQKIKYVNRINFNSRFLGFFTLFIETPSSISIFKEIYELGLFNV